MAIHSQHQLSRLHTKLLGLWLFGQGHCYGYYKVFLILFLVYYFLYISVLFIIKLFRDVTDEELFSTYSWVGLSQIT